MKRGDSNQRQNLLNAKMMKKNKEIIGALPPFMFIVTEGTATETNYIEGFSSVSDTFLMASILLIDVANHLGICSKNRCGVYSDAILDL